MEEMTDHPHKRQECVLLSGQSKSAGFGRFTSKTRLCVTLEYLACTEAWENGIFAKQKIYFMLLIYEAFNSLEN